MRNLIFRSNYSIPSTESSTDLMRPPNKEAIYEWFQKTELQRKAGIDPSTNKLAAWFHGEPEPILIYLQKERIKTN